MYSPYHHPSQKIPIIPRTNLSGQQKTTLTPSMGSNSILTGVFGNMWGGFDDVTKTRQWGGILLVFTKSTDAKHLETHGAGLIMKN